MSCRVRFSFSVLSHKIGWEERLRNDLFCVKWDVKPEINQSSLLVFLPEPAHLRTFYFALFALID